MIDKITEAFKNSTIEVLEKITGESPEVFEITPEEEKNLSCSISGIIGMTGSTKANITLSLSDGAVNVIYSKMFSEDAKEATFNQLADMVGELTNIISGTARRLLSEQDIKFKSAIPTVMIGNRQLVSGVAGTIMKVVPFKLSEYLFYLEVVVES